jgi:hypothetical protein
MQLITTLFIFGLSLSSLAMPFNGLINKSSINGYTLSLSSTSQVFKLATATARISEQLNKMSVGDLISIEADIANSTTLKVNAINYVGLKNLIGIWYGNDNFCYSFESFTEMILLKRVGSQCLSSLETVYTYTLSPNSKAWDLIVASDMSSFIGDIKFTTSKVANITLFDSETGEIVKVVRLVKR